MAPGHASVLTSYSGEAINGEVLRTKAVASVNGWNDQKMSVTLLAASIAAQGLILGNADSGHE
jgi:hypothetical protein